MTYTTALIVVAAAAVIYGALGFCAMYVQSKWMADYESEKEKGNHNG